MESQTIAVAFVFDPPSIFDGIVKAEAPSARANIGALGPYPSVVKVNGIKKQLSPEEKIEIPLNMHAADMCRFLAKVAYGYAISRRGLGACREYFLPRIILGETDGAQTYIGGASPSVFGARLPGDRLHAMVDRLNGEFLSVYIQLFRARFGDEPIYEVVVGRV